MPTSSLGFCHPVIGLRLTGHRHCIGWHFTVNGFLNEPVEAPSQTLFTRVCSNVVGNGPRRRRGGFSSLNPRPTPAEVAYLSRKIGTFVHLLAPHVLQNRRNYQQKTNLFVDIFTMLLRAQPDLPDLHAQCSPAIDVATNSYLPLYTYFPKGPRQAPVVLSPSSPFPLCPDLFCSSPASSSCVPFRALPRGFTWKPCF